MLTPLPPHFNPPPPASYRPTDGYRQPRPIDPLSRAAAHSPARLLHRGISPRATPQRWAGEADLQRLWGGGRAQRFEGSC